MISVRDHVRVDKILSTTDQPTQKEWSFARGVPFTFCDLFAGIGGMRLGLEAVGGECVYSCEYDKHAQKTYSCWFGETPAGDIRDVIPSELKDHDLLAAGFPCQPFSIAGVSKKKAGAGVQRRRGELGRRRARRPYQ